MAWVNERYTYSLGSNKQLLASGAKTSTFDTTSVSDGRTWRMALFVVNVTASSGSSPTLDLRLQLSNDDSTWVDVDALNLTQITGTGQSILLVRTPAERKYVRLEGTVAGTTPSFTLSIEFYAFGYNTTVA